MAKKEEGISEKAVHTKGPWELFHVVTGRDHTTAILSAGTKREIVQWGGFDASDFQEDNLANARLIAAAPDLLEGSLELLEMLKEGYGWNEQNCGCDVDGQGNHAPLCPVIKLQSAIRKARGEQL
ncbi:MAG: hypothetical protein JWQ87_2277 [Candidatus Sulfotelmatobacter sp.]|nr:hypothetical protein [Candidatus Sulfotelmatobacter sp.]